MLKDKLDAFEGQPEQGWNKRKSISVGERGQVYRAIFSIKIFEGRRDYPSLLPSCIGLE